MITTKSHSLRSCYVNSSRVTLRNHTYSFVKRKIVENSSANFKILFSWIFKLIARYVTLERTIWVTRHVLYQSLMKFKNIMFWNHYREDGFLDIVDRNRYTRWLIASFLEFSKIFRFLKSTLSESSSKFRPRCRMILFLFSSVRALYLRLHAYWYLLRSFFPSVLFNTDQIVSMICEIWRKKKVLIKLSSDDSLESYWIYRGSISYSLIKIDSCNLHFVYAKK